MFNILKVRKRHGYQAIPDIKKAVIREPYRGLPSLDDSSCSGCGKCAEICPSDAISLNPLSLDMGRCIFCGDCAAVCPEQSVTFTNHHKIAASESSALVIHPGISPEEYRRDAMACNADIHRLFGHSLKLRQVSAGGCGGCEWELNACGNVNFDMGRFGIELVASPRHADGLIITGPVTENMADALEDAYMSVPEPKIVILTGACAISGGIFRDAAAIDRGFMDRHHIDLYIPGCPAHPLTIINGILDFLGA